LATLVRNPNPYHLPTLGRWRFSIIASGSRSLQPTARAPLGDRRDEPRIRDLPSHFVIACLGAGSATERRDLGAVSLLAPTLRRCETASTSGEEFGATGQIAMRIDNRSVVKSFSVF